MTKGTILSLILALFVLAGCARVSDYLAYPMGDYRAEKEIRARYLNEVAKARGDLISSDTGEVVFPAGTTVTVKDIRYRPTEFPKATGIVVVESEDGKKLKLGFASRIKEHFLIELERVLAFDEIWAPEALPLRLTLAEERAIQIATLKQEFVGRRLWLVRDVPCTEGSKRQFLPAGSEVSLEEASVLVSDGLSGERILSRLEFEDGEGSSVTIYLDEPRQSFAEWYHQMSEVVTTEVRIAGPELLPVGLNREAVLAAWGPPDLRRGRLSEAGVKEEWTYALRGQTLVFVDGRLAGR